MSLYHFVVVVLFTRSLVTKASEAWDLGCYADNSTEREFRISAGNYKVTDTSPQECTSACATLKNTYAATQGVLCFCGNTKNRLIKVADNLCATVCNQSVCSNMVYLRVYHTRDSIAGLNVFFYPKSGYVFESVNYSSTLEKGFINATYTFKFGDGSFVLSTCENSTHKYTRNGRFKVTVSARNSQSGPIHSSKWIYINSPMGQTELRCPSTIVAAGSRTTISMYVSQGTNLRGSWIETNGARIPFNISEITAQHGYGHAVVCPTHTKSALIRFIDAVMFDVGSRATFGNISGSPQVNGTYILPTSSFKREGYIVAWELYASKVGGIQLQVFRPTCSSDQESYCPQNMSCIPKGSSCADSRQFSCPGDGSICVSTGHCLQGCLSQNITYPVSGSPLMNYTLISDNLVNIKKVGYQLIPLPTGKSIQVRIGDVIGWTANSSDLAFEQTTNDPEFFYPFSSFSPSIGSTMDKKGPAVRQEIKHVLRAHLSQTSWATKDYTFSNAGVYNVSVIVEGEANNIQLSKLEYCLVSVQERITNLRIWEPKCYDDSVSYPANRNVSLQAKMDSGSNVTLTWITNQSSVVTRDNEPAFLQFTSSGIHKLTLFAVNNITVVSVSTMLSVLVEVGDITILSPLTEIDVGVLGNYSFSLSSGTNVTVEVTFDNKQMKPLFIDEANNTVFNFSYAFTRGGMKDIVVTAKNNIIIMKYGSKKEVFNQKVKGKIGDITVETQPEKTSEGVLKIATDQNFELFISSSLEIPINFTINTGAGDPEFITTKTGKTKIKKKYIEDFSNNITIIASSNGESSDRYIPVKATRCGPPAIFFPVRNTKDSPYVVTRATEISLKSRAVWSRNSGCDYGDLSYKWDVYNMDDGTAMDVHLEDSPNFIVTPGQLKQGNYSVNSTITYSTTHVQDKYLYQTYLRVLQSDLVARITGGSPRDVPYNHKGNLTLDGSQSLDPGDPKSKLKKLEFSWKCRRHNDSVTNALFAKRTLDGSEYCTNLTYVLPNKDKTAPGETIKLPLKYFLQNASYDFELRVFKDEREKIFEQQIKIVPEDNPEMVMDCHGNCKQKVNTQDRLILQARCNNCKGSTADLQFRWSILDPDRRPVNLNDPPITTTGWYSMGLVIKSDKLEVGTKYILKLDVTRRGKTVVVEQEIVTSTPPYDGECVALLETGTAAKDEYAVDCKGWRTEDYPLKYEFYYISVRKDEARINSLPIEARVSTLWYYGPFHKTPPSVLPVGEETEDYLMLLVVKIYNFYGAFNKSELNVTVYPWKMSLEDVRKIKEELKKQSEDMKENPQKAIQWVTSAASIVNFNNDEETLKNKAQREERTKLRSQCVDIAVQIGVKPGLEPIAEVSNAVTVSIQKKDEVTSSTQVKASQFFNRMSEKVSFEARIKGHEAKSAVKVEETAQVIFTGVSHNFDASSKTTEDYIQQVLESLNKTEGTPSRDWAVRIRKRKGDEAAIDAEDVVKTLYGAMNHLTDAIQQNKLIAENETQVTTHAFSMQVQKRQWDSVGNRSIEVLRDGKPTGSFTLPSESALLGGKTTDIENEDPISIQVVSFIENPIRWDKISSPYMSKDVIGLELRLSKGGKHRKLEIKDTTEDIEIQIPVAETNTDYYSASFNHKTFLKHHYRIENAEALKFPLLVHVNPTERLTLYILFGKYPTTTTYAFMLELPFLNDSLPWPYQKVDNHTFLIMDLDYFGSSKADLYFGLKATDLVEQRLQVPGSSGGVFEVSSILTVNYTIEIRSVGCRYWTEKEPERWNDQGCSLSNKTTMTMTHFNCNHLTFFGSMIVKPNPIGKLTAKQFESGYALFVSVSIIFLFYFLGLVWARKKDKADLIKVGVCPLPDNDPSDPFRYEITLWTSMRRGAGTTSKVNLFLYGEEHDTDARALEDPERKPFQRGSVDTFLLTTSFNLGPLPYIRIWHNNLGGSWLLSRVMVIDLQNDDRYYFICNRWLAVDEDDGQVERLIPLASREELTEFQHLFVARTRRNLSDSHLWFSVFARPANSRFTRVQRLSCCLCLLLMSMMTSAMWYKSIIDKTTANSQNFGGMVFTWEQVFIGIASSLIVFPVNLIVVQIFRSVRPKPHRIRHKKTPNPTRLSLTVQNLTAYNRMKDSSDESKGSNNSIDSTQEKNARMRLSINDVHTDVDRISFTGSPLLLDNRRRSTVWEDGGSRLHRFLIWFKKHSSLPYYFVYLAWFLVFIFSTGSAIVVIMYGMKFGNMISLQWLVSSIISFIQDVLITQPLKVLGTAIFFALVIKKPDKGEFEIPSEAAELAEDEDWLYSMATGNNKSQKRNKVKLLPPDQAKLIIMRKARMKERKMYAVIQELAFFYLFLFLVLMIAYNHKDHMAFVQTNNFKDMFSTHFLNISKNSEFWNWTHQEFLPNLFPSKWYNGKALQPDGFLSDHNSQMVGGARLRLVRIKNESCLVPKEVTSITRDCFGEYIIGDDDENDYLPSWENVTTYPKRVSRKDVFWRYQGWKALDGYPLWANVTTYSGGGYILVLEPGMDNLKNLKYLEEKMWLDRHSRAVITEFTAYNAQTNLFSIVTLAAEFPATGGVLPFMNIQTARLYNYTKDYMFFVLVCEGFFVLFILFFLYREAKLIYKEGGNHFKQFWNIVECVIIGSASLGIGLYIYRLLKIKDVVTRSRNAPFQFMSFQFAGYWDEMYTFAIAILVTFSTIKLNKLLRFNKRMSLLSSTLKYIAFPLAMFGVLFGIIFLAFTLIATVVFGTSMQGYRSVASSFTSLLSLMLGKTRFKGMYETNRIIGPLFFFTFMFLVSMVLINMFLSIIIDGYYVVKRDMDKQSNEHEIVDFIIDRFKLWSGIGKVRKPRRTQRRVLWNMAASKVKAIQAFNNSRMSLVSNGLYSDNVSELENRLEKLIERTDLLFDEIFPEKRHLVTKGKVTVKKGLSSY